MSRLQIPLIDGKFPNYYTLLGVSRSASPRDVTLAYRKKALDQHPDKVGGGQDQNELFAHINNARDALSDPDKRREYDIKLNQHLRTIAGTLRPSIFTPPAPRPTSPKSAPPKPQNQPGRRSSSYGSYRDPKAEDDSDNESRKRSGDPHSARWKSYFEHGHDIPEKPKSRPFGQPFDDATHPRYQSRQDAAADSNFIPRGFPITYNHFKPPSSAYPVDFDKRTSGIKPHPSSAWARFAHNGSTLGRFHEQGCKSAVDSCYVASGIKSILMLLQHSISVRRGNRLFGEDETLWRIFAATELAVEVMHFAAARYAHHRTQLDELTHSLGFQVAAEKVAEHSNVLTLLLSLLTSTRNVLDGIRVAAGNNFRADADDSLEKMSDVFENWRKCFRLPMNIREGMTDIFCTTGDRFKDEWVRTSVVLGGKYDMKPFEVKCYTNKRGPAFDAGYEGGDEQGFGKQNFNQGKDEEQRQQQHHQYGHYHSHHHSDQHDHKHEHKQRNPQPPSSPPQPPSNEDDMDFEWDPRPGNVHERFYDARERWGTPNPGRDEDAWRSFGGRAWTSWGSNPRDGAGKNKSASETDQDRASGKEDEEENDIT